MMKYRLLNILCCPECQAELMLHVFSEELIPPQLAKSDCAEKEIIDGLLTCKCGTYYPIINRIPRFIDEKITYFKEFVNKYNNNLKEIIKYNADDCHYDDYHIIRQSFSNEWNIFQYDEDKTWGWNLEERKKIFLNDLNIRKDDLKGKLLLDAGCGNGSLTAAVNSFGVEIVGFDLHDGLEKADEYKAKFTKGDPNSIHFVQGNLFKPPFRKNTFDYIYSSGVIHHTPNSKNTFNKICPLLKKSGRMYVWVYGERPFAVKLFQGMGRIVRDCLSLSSLYKMCKLISPIYKISSEFLNYTGIMPFRKRTTREITLDLFDAFSPKYNHRHKENEVVDWFKENHFDNINISGIQKHGFGVYGDSR